MTEASTQHPEAVLVLAGELMSEVAEASLAGSKAVALAALKLEMEGLASLFGGYAGIKSGAGQREEEADTEASFDNMPV